MKRGYIVRRFGKQSGKQACEDEMPLRASSPDHGLVHSDVQSNGSGDTASKTGPSEPGGPGPMDSDAISSQLLMVETREHY